MPLNPGKFGVHTRSISRINQLPDINNEILVEHFTIRRRAPAVLLPALVPDRRAVDRVVAVCDDLQVVGLWDSLESSQDGCQFCTLVRLRFSLQRF